ncbi:MAG: pyridoxal phosphate-dependent aminotransferase [Anaerolineales bacterium]|nr:pyridoxal phosphate-dependent aminotransferase [Anaerolineales bacterium]
MKPLARTAAHMPGSGIREIVHLALTMPDVIRLEVGEPNFPTPIHIVEAAYQAANAGFTKYGPSGGLQTLRELLAGRVSRVNGYPVTAAQVNISVGGVQGILAALSALLDPGDEVLIPDPAWPNYEMAILLREAVPVHYPLYIEHGFVPQTEHIESLITPRTKLMIINSPSNPTGAVFPRETIESLVALAQRHDLYLLSDEVYDELVFEGEHVSPALYDAERTIGIYAFSKNYAMTGWRVGYVVANEEVSRVITKIQEPMISCVASPIQKAAEAALTGPQDCIGEMRDSYRERRDAVVELLKEEGYYVYTPAGAFYIMVDISDAGVDSRQFALNLLEQCRVAVAPGTAFGKLGDHFVRISLATEKGLLLEGLRRLCEFVKSEAKRR